MEKKTDQTSGRSLEEVGRKECAETTFPEVKLGGNPYPKIQQESYTKGETIHDSLSSYDAEIPRVDCSKVVVPQLQGNSYPRSTRAGVLTPSVDKVKKIDDISESGTEEQPAQCEERWRKAMFHTLDVTDRDCRKAISTKLNKLRSTLSWQEATIDDKIRMNRSSIQQVKAHYASKRKGELTIRSGETNFDTNVQNFKSSKYRCLSASESRTSSLPGKRVSDFEDSTWSWDDTLNSTPNPTQLPPKPRRVTGNLRDFSKPYEASTAGPRGTVLFTGPHASIVEDGFGGSDGD